MLEVFYCIFLFLGILGLIGYKTELNVTRILFGVSAGISLVAFVYFLSHITQSYGFTLFGSFLFSPRFEVSPLEGFFSAIVCLISFVVAIYSIDFVKHIKDSNISIFYSMYNFFILSMLLVISVSNVFAFLLLWEIMTLLSALFLKFNDTENSNFVVMAYLGIAQVGAFCISVALMLIGYFAGSFDFATWSGVGSHIPLGFSITILALLFIGFGSKAGMFPFHVWSPLAYPLAPSNISALMSGVMSKIAIFGFIKFALFVEITPFFALCVIIIGALSALVGITYALIEREYKNVIAYSSMENIGIILLGVGAGMYGLSINDTLLILLGFGGALWHVLNHSVFKSLLFLGAGAIYVSTKETLIDSLGGLARKMPYTAALFLVASLAISAFPPLNGFISEWFTYKSLLLGAGEPSFFARIIFALSIIALALTGAMVAYAFIRLYGNIFGGVAKVESVFDRAKESSSFMLGSMSILAFLCVVLGLGASSVMDILKDIISSFAPHVILIESNSAIPLSLIGIALIFGVLLFLPFVAFFIFRANSKDARLTPPWACGFKFDKRMQVNSETFVGDMKRVFKIFLRHKGVSKQDNYFTNMSYESKSDNFWWRIFYEPIVTLSVKIADMLGIIQNGKSSFYVIYILVYLYVMLIISIFILGA